MRFLEFRGIQESFCWYIVLNGLEGSKALDLLFLLLVIVHLFVSSIRIVELFLRSCKLCLGFSKLFLDVHNLSLLFVYSG